MVASSWNRRRRCFVVGLPDRVRVRASLIGTGQTACASSEIRKSRIEKVVLTEQVVLIEPVAQWRGLSGREF